MEPLPTNDNETRSKKDPPKHFHFESLSEEAQKDLEDFLDAALETTPEEKSARKIPKPNS